MATNTADKSVNDQKLKGMPPASKITESLPGRSRGSLLFKRSQNGTINAYFRYRLNAKDTMISLGQYRLSARASGLILSEIRDKAAEMALIASEHGDVKTYLAARTAEEKTKRQAVALAEKATTQQGSFEELLNAYTEDLTARKKVKAEEVERLFQTHVIKHHPDLMVRSAKSNTGEDIHLVMSALLARKPKGRGIGKAKAASTDMRSTAASVHRYLKAAFNYAGKAHLSLDRDVSNSKIFDICVNPATRVPTLANTCGGQTESLTPEEFGELLRHLDTLPLRETAICKGLIYLGGQRMEQMLRVTWEETHNGLWIQPVDATDWLRFSAGVS
ncbi:hypothetical protein [Pseudomonas fluorescens]|uniref:Integrase n=1 Tax=Pseudomonas fluorescens TaxID=294 RepID=A0A5E7DH64_PSEFL|nr:hypothetical protein [Pseudomonas fluorescens]VVO16829.1 hypothetical protein PS723_03881 [Pseudomonas fluorescens]